MMSVRPSIVFACLLLALAGVSAFALAETQRQYEAHEHGAASLLVSADGAELVIVLDSPAFNLFGFEHAPSTTEQQAAVDDALARLITGAGLFVINRSAGCELEDSHVVETASTLQMDPGHDEHEAAGGHSDVVVEWHFHCDSPSDLAEIEVGLFDTFPNLTDLDAQYLLDAAQGAQSLSPDNTRLRF